MATTGFPIADVAIAGIAALGDFLFGSSQDEGTKMVGRPNQAFSAQDQARGAISGELGRAQAARGQPIALPEIDLSGLGGQINVPGLDIALGLDPSVLALGNQDFFGGVNAQRAAFNDANPGAGVPRAAPRGGRSEPSERGAAGLDPRAGEALSAPSLRQQQAETLTRPGGQQAFDNPDGTLDLIGEAIQSLLARTDASKIRPV